MTNQEAIEYLKAYRHRLTQSASNKLDKDIESFDMAIKALEQEPKTGHWIAQDIHNCHTDFKCSECGYIHNFIHLYGKPAADYTYCPNCGAKMVEPNCNTCIHNHGEELECDVYACMFEPQESEDKE